MATSVLLRSATAADIEALCGLIFEHGPNPWNHLPPEPVRMHLQGIADGSVQTLLAEEGGQLLGFVSFLTSQDFCHYQAPERRELPQAYIAEAVVRREQAGRGLGSRLLWAARDELLRQGVADVYIERHEENQASAGMMRKAGFRELLTFADPARRPNGSQRTTLCYWQAAPRITG